MRLFVLLVVLCLAVLMPSARAYTLSPVESLDTMATKADVVCKAKVVSIPSDAPYRPATLELITVFKGDVTTSRVRFWHLTNPKIFGPNAPPQYYDLEVGRTYLFFAKNSGPAGDLEQIREHPTEKMDNGVMLASDELPLKGLSIKQAHWRELARLMTNSTPEDAFYAIGQLYWMTTRCDHTNGLHHPADRLNSRATFEWKFVSPLLQRLVEHRDDQVAIAAIHAFTLSSGCASSTNTPADFLVRQANLPGSALRRSAALRALSAWPASAFATNLPSWLADSSDAVRAKATLLLSATPRAKAISMLGQQARDPAPEVRAAAAGAIGAGSFNELIPLLATLLEDSTGRTNKQVLQPTDRTSFLNRSGLVRSAAAYALLHFPPGQVDSLLRAHLNDDYFKPAFLARLAATNAEPWLNDLADVMERQLQVTNWGQESRSGYPIVSHPYRECFMRLVEALEKQSTTDLVAGKFDRHLDALERVSGSQELEDIYRFYVLKGLHERAKRYKETVLKQRSGMEYYFQRAERDAAQGKKLHFP